MAYKPEEIATMLINAIPNDTPKSEVASGAALFVADLIAQFGFDHTIHSAIKNMIDCYVGAIKEGNIKHT